MRKFLLVVCAYLIFATVLLFAIEGMTSIANWRQAGRSMTYDIYRKLTGSAAGRADSVLPTASREEIEALIPEMIIAGVGMGNVPYKELANARAALNEVGADGCRGSKPGVRKVMTYIRSADYEQFDQPTLFHDKDSPLSTPLADFIEKYAVRKVEFNTGVNGERLTLPTLALPRKVLIAGDSVAAGAMIADNETIASQLQLRDDSKQYVNLGVNGAKGEDIICRLKSALQRYKGEVAKIVYVFCENDFDKGDPFGTPEEVADWLKQAAESKNIPEVTIVYAPYIYNVMPHLTRFQGTREMHRKTFKAEVSALETAAKEAGFKYISIADIAMEQAKESGSDLAAFSVFVDSVHLSNHGVSRLVDKLLD